MKELSRDAPQTLWEDGEFVLSHSVRDVALAPLLVTAPVLAQPAPESLQRLAHAYALREELDPCRSLTSESVATLDMSFSCMHSCSAFALRLISTDFQPVREPIEVGIRRADAVTLQCQRRFEIGREHATLLQWLP